MEGVRWIKITTDIFDDEKIILIENMPESDSIIVIWFKLLCLAGKKNNSGVFLLNDKIPYTEDMLAAIFRRKLSTVQLALETFKKLGMIEVVDDTITLPNWGKYQNIEQLEKNREYMKKYMQNYRTKQKKMIEAKENSGFSEQEGDDCKGLRKGLRKDLCKADVNGTDKESDSEKESEEEKKNLNYMSVIKIYNDTCVSLPKAKTITEKRKKAIRARLSTYSMDDIVTVFQKAEQSDWLKGKNNRDWRADFDWLMREENMAKVLEGRYDRWSSNGSSGKTNSHSGYRSKMEMQQDDFDYTINSLNSWVAKHERSGEDEQAGIF